MPLSPVDPPAVKPVWNEVSIFKSGADVLQESGFDTTYLGSTPPVADGSATSTEVAP
jgi:hypothetical protein